MQRTRYTLVLAVLAFAAPAFGADTEKHAAGDGPAHKKPVYNVAGEDHQGRHVTKTLDMANPAHVTELRSLMEDGHVHVHDASPPTISKLASLSADLGVWSLVIFLLLLFILSRLAWPNMIAGLQKREDTIRGALDEAEKAKSEAQALRASLQKDMDNAHLQVKALIDEAKRDAEVTAADVLAKARADIATDRERLQREIRTETEQAMQSLWTRAADLATQASAKALRRQLDGDSQRRLIDEAIAELRSAPARANGYA